MNNNGLKGVTRSNTIKLNNKRNTRKIITLVLIICLVVTRLYGYQPMNKTKAKDNKPKDVKELTDERTENSNTYLMSDGTKKKEIFLEDIRYKENGEFVDYDSSLSTPNKADTKILKNKTNEDSKDYLLTNTSGKCKQFFPVDLNEQNGIVLNYKNYVLEMAPVVGDNVFDIDHKNNKIEYKTPLKEMKYEYISLNNGVKENIVLNEKPETNEFSFNVMMKNLYLKKKDKGIFVYDKKTDKKVAYINPPNIKDDKGDFDYESVKYELKEDNNKTILIVKVDDEYFNNEKLKYPVVIDPSMYWTSYTLNLVGVNSMSSLSDSTITGNPLKVSNKLLNASPYNTMETRLFLKTNNLLNGNTFVGGGESLKDMYIESASLRFVEGEQPYYYPDGGDVEIKSVEGTWSESSITWNNQPNISSGVVDTIECSGELDDVHLAEITSWVQDIANEKWKIPLFPLDRVI